MVAVALSAAADTECGQAAHPETPRETTAPLGTRADARSDDSSPARGLVVAVLVSLPLWALILVAGRLVAATS